MKKILAAFAASLCFVVGACGKDEKKTETPAATAPTDKSGAVTTLTLPASFSSGTSPACSVCHGAKGEGQGSAGAMAALAKGEFSDVSKFIAVVRSGTSAGMPKFSATDISDAELTKIHAFFKQ